MTDLFQRQRSILDLNMTGPPLKEKKRCHHGGRTLTISSRTGKVYRWCYLCGALGRYNYKTRRFKWQKHGRS